REPIAIPAERMLEERLERVRKKIVPPFEIFAAGVAQSKFRPDGKKLAGLIRDLWTELDVEETLEVWTAMDLNQARGRGGAAVHSTVWEALGEWLAALELAFSNEAMHAREWLPVVETGLAHLTVGVIPPTLDEVLIGAVDRARNPELKFSLVLGVNDTIFPAAPAPSAVLTDMDRQELHAWAALGPDLRERLSRERYYGYIAFTRAHERVLASCSRTDCGGAPLTPSPFIKRLQTLFPAVQIEEFDARITLDAVESIHEMVPRLIELRNAVSDDPIFRREHVSRALNSLEDLRQADPLEPLSPAMAERLYGRILKTSVSRLEEFAQCPFKFFVRSGLRAGERKVFELDARERGTFQHEVLKVFHEQLVAENRRWRDLTPAQARQRVGQIAADLAGDYRDGLLRHSGRTRFDAQAITVSLQNFIEVIVSWMREQYEFDPAAVEMAFGEKNSPLPAWPIPLDGGRQLLLRGRIDRVDLCKNPPDGKAWFVVLDYKSSPRKLDPALVENGIQLQLPAYLSALSNFADLRRLFGVEKLVPAGVFYLNLRGQPENGKTREDILQEGDRARRAAYRHTGRFDAGMLHKLDSAGAQDQFQYSRKRDGTLRKGTIEALAQADFEAWLEHAESQLQRIGNEIFSGQARVDPYRKGTETACDYCDYATVCRIDRWTHRFRTLTAKNASTE
ncbi:MAG: PD-(D/E)XK nuclease family protein, partial [Limisphaerales bacterium]